MNDYSFSQTEKPESVTMDEVMIREATLQDLPDIVSCSRSTDLFQMSNYIDNEADEDELRFWIEDPRALVLVAVGDSELLAYAYGVSVSPKWFFFDAFLVAPRARGRGLGKRLYRRLREACKLRGLQLIQGLVKDADNQALGYWLDRGFEAGNKCIWVEDWLDDD